MMHTPRYTLYCTDSINMYPILEYEHQPCFDRGSKVPQGKNDVMTLREVRAARCSSSYRATQVSVVAWRTEQHGGAVESHSFHRHKVAQ